MTDIDLDCDKSYQHEPGRTCEHCRIYIPVIATPLNDAAAEIEPGEMPLIVELLASLNADGEDYDLNVLELHLLIRFAIVGCEYMAAGSHFQEDAR